MNGWRSFRHKWYLHPASRSEDFWNCHSINLLCNHAFFPLRFILSTEKNHLCVCRCVSQVFCEACRKTLQAGNQRPLRPCGNSDKILLLFPPLPALCFLSFSVRRGKRWGREAKQRHVCLCHRRAGPLTRLSERQNAPFSMAFRIPTLEKVAGERTACRPHGNKTLGRVEKRGCRSTLGPCPHSQVMCGTFCVTWSITHCCFWPHTHPLL